MNYYYFDCVYVFIILILFGYNYLTKSGFSLEKKIKTKYAKNCE